MEFNSFLKLMAHKKASDLFITVGMPVAMKVHGRIQPISQNPLTAGQSRDLVLGIMTPSQKEEFERTHECKFAIGVQGTIGQRSFETGSVLVYMDNTVMAITPVPTNRFVMHPIDPQFLQDPGSPGIGFWQTSQACELELVVTGTGGGFSLCQVVQAGCTGAPTLSCPPSCSSLVNSILLIPDSLRFLTGN